MTNRLGGNNMSLLFLVETRNAFDYHVVALCCTGGKNDILRFCTN